jgi:hypothetical protein
MGDVITLPLIVLELAGAHPDDFTHTLGFRVELGQPQKLSQQERQFARALIGQGDAHDAVTGMCWDTAPEIGYNGLPC